MSSKKDRIAIPTEDDVARYAPTGDTGAQPPAVGPSAAGGQPTVDSLSAELETCKDKLLRAQAECANVAKRLTQQHAESWRYAALDLAKSLLPVLDSLERTIKSLSEAEASGPLAEGVKLVADQLLKSLSDHGVQPIEAVGKPFDPARHEALMQDRQSAQPAGTVTAEMQRGYTIHDRVLRPARVAVAAEPAGEGQSPAAADENTAGEIASE